MLSDKINKQESKEGPKDIVELFEVVFGNEIFFIEDLVALERENKELFKKLSKLDDVSNKRSVSIYLAGVIRKFPNRIEKHSYGLSFEPKIPLTVTALRIFSASNFPITKDIAKKEFQRRFKSLIDNFPVKKSIEVEKPISEEESIYYERLKRVVKEAIKEHGCFRLEDCPYVSNRNNLISRLLKFGLIKHKDYKLGKSFTDSEFVLSEN